jgi:hypothetical protein
MLAVMGEAFPLCVVIQDIYGGEVFDEGLPLITTRPKDRYDYLLGRWLFFNAFLPLLDGWCHMVLDEHYG